MDGAAQSRGQDRTIAWRDLSQALHALRSRCKDSDEGTSYREDATPMLRSALEQVFIASGGDGMIQNSLEIPTSTEQAEHLIQAWTDVMALISSLEPSLDSDMVRAMWVVYHQLWRYIGVQQVENEDDAARAGEQLRLRRHLLRRLLECFGNHLLDVDEAGDSADPKDQDRIQKYRCGLGTIFIESLLDMAVMPDKSHFSMIVDKELPSLVRYASMDALDTLMMRTSGNKSLARQLLTPTSVAPIIAQFADFHVVSFCLELAFRCQPKVEAARRDWTAELLSSKYHGDRAVELQRQWLAIRTKTYPEQIADFVQHVSLQGDARAQRVEATHVDYRGFTLANDPNETKTKGLELWFAVDSLQAVCGVQDCDTGTIQDERLIIPYSFVSRVAMTEKKGHVYFKFSLREAPYFGSDRLEKERLALAVSSSGKQRTASLGESSGSADRTLDNVLYVQVSIHSAPRVKIVLARVSQTYENLVFPPRPFPSDRQAFKVVQASSPDGGTAVIHKSVNPINIARPPSSSRSGQARKSSQGEPIEGYYVEPKSSQSLSSTVIPVESRDFRGQRGAAPQRDNQHRRKEVAQLAAIDEEGVTADSPKRDKRSTAMPKAGIGANSFEPTVLVAESNSFEHVSSRPSSSLGADSRKNVGDRQSGLTESLCEKAEIDWTGLGATDSPLSDLNGPSLALHLREGAGPTSNMKPQSSRMPATRSPRRLLPHDAEHREKSVVAQKKVAHGFTGQTASANESTPTDPVGVNITTKRLSGKSGVPVKVAKVGNVRAKPAAQDVDSREEQESKESTMNVRATRRRRAGSQALTEGPRPRKRVRAEEDVNLDTCDKDIENAEQRPHEVSVEQRPYGASAEAAAASVAVGPAPPPSLPLANKPHPAPAKKYGKEKRPRKYVKRTQRKENSRAAFDKPRQRRGGSGKSRSSSKDGDTESEETDYDEELPAAVPVKHDLARARAKSKLVLAKRKSSGRKKPQSSEEIDESNNDQDVNDNEEPACVPAERPIRATRAIAGVRWTPKHEERTRKRQCSPSLDTQQMVFSPANDYQEDMGGCEQIPEDTGIEKFVVPDESHSDAIAGHRFDSSGILDPAQDESFVDKAVRTDSSQNENLRKTQQHQDHPQISRASVSSASGSERSTTSIEISRSKQWPLRSHHHKQSRTSDVTASEDEDEDEPMNDARDISEIASKSTDSRALRADNRKLDSNASISESDHNTRHGIVGSKSQRQHVAAPASDEDVEMSGTDLFAVDDSGFHEVNLPSPRKKIHPATAAELSEGSDQADGACTSQPSEAKSGRDDAQRTVRPHQNSLHRRRNVKFDSTLQYIVQPAGDEECDGNVVIMVQSTPATARRLHDRKHAQRNNEVDAEEGEQVVAKHIRSARIEQSAVGPPGRIRGMSERQAQEAGRNGYRAVMSQHRQSRLQSSQPRQRESPRAAVATSPRQPHTSLAERLTSLAPARQRQAERLRKDRHGVQEQTQRRRQQQQQQQRQRQSISSNSEDPYPADAQGVRQDSDASHDEEEVGPVDVAIEYARGQLHDILEGLLDRTRQRLVHQGELIDASRDRISAEAQILARRLHEAPPCGAASTHEVLKLFTTQGHKIRHAKVAVEELRQRVRRQRAARE